VVDTSYLWELVNSGKETNSPACQKVRGLFKKAQAAHARLYVPMPCIFELANHVAKVKHDARRKKLADWLFDSVVESLDERVPWIITPAGDPKTILSELLQTFRNQVVKKGIGLVDLFAASEAKRLKKEHSDRNANVHIWTNERALKAMEPDPERNPFLW
jgi:hypothetical protein